MKERLITALNGTGEEKEAAALQIKALPRSAEGIFDMTYIDGNFYEACGLVFPLYAAYETRNNKKAGYPDIMEQIRVLEKRILTEFTQENVSLYAKMLIDTIQVMSPEIYEYYRELADRFRDVVREAIAQFGLKAGMEMGGFDKAEDARIFGEALNKAFQMDILLQEKYEALWEAVSA